MPIHYRHTQQFPETYCVVNNPSTYCSTNLAPGTWTWHSGTVYNVNGGAKSSDPSGKLAPNPGNPTTETFTIKENAVANSHGAVDWYMIFEAKCAGSDCNKHRKDDKVGPVKIGISTCDYINKKTCT